MESGQTDQKLVDITLEKHQVNEYFLEIFFKTVIWLPLDTSKRPSTSLSSLDQPKCHGACPPTYSVTSSQASLPRFKPLYKKTMPSRSISRKKIRPSSQQSSIGYYLATLTVTNHMNSLIPMNRITVFIGIRFTPSQRGITVRNSVTPQSLGRDFACFWANHFQIQQKFRAYLVRILQTNASRIW